MEWYWWLLIIFLISRYNSGENTKKSKKHSKKAHKRTIRECMADPTINPYD